MRHFTDKILAGEKELATEDIIALASKHKKALMDVVDNPSTELASTRALRKYIYEYAVADKEGLRRLTDAAIPDIGAVTFAMRGLKSINKKVDASGIRYAFEGTYFGKTGQPIMPSGKMSNLNEATFKLRDPLDNRVQDLMGQFGDMQTKLRTVPGTGPLGESSTSLDQLIGIRTRAAVLQSEPGIGEASAGAAKLVLEETKHMMANPANASKAFKTKLAEISTYMEESERVNRKLWVKRLLDPKYRPEYGTPYDLGVDFFTLADWETIAEAKHMLTSGKNVVGMAHKWEEIKMGFQAKLLNNPSDIPALIGNKDNHKALNILFNKGELDTFERMANDLSIFQDGPIARLMAHSDKAANVAKTFWESNNTQALRDFMVTAGGPDSPQGRAMAASFFQLLIKENSTAVRGVDVINKSAIAKAMFEMRGRGWTEILLGAKKAEILNVRGIETALSMMVGSANMGAGLITSTMSQGAIGGALAAPKKAMHGYRKWFSNFLASRMLIGPVMQRAAGLPNLRYFGSIDGKHLVPTEKAYFRTFADMVAASREIAEEDAIALGFAGPDQRFSGADLHESMSGTNGHQLIVDPNAAPPRAGATLPGTSTLGMPNQPRAPGGLGGGGGNAPAPQRPQPTPRVGGGLPTNQGAGVPPGPRPNSGPR
jgi:hypothetical protein